MRTAASPHLAMPWFSWYCLGMDMTPFDLTPAQKGLLEALARETGKAIPALLDEALQGLQDQGHLRRENGTATEHATATRAAEPHDSRPPIWEGFFEASL